MEVVRYPLSPAYTQHLAVPAGATFLKVLGVKNDFGGIDVHLYMLQNPFTSDMDDIAVISVGEHMTLPPSESGLEYLDSVVIEDVPNPMAMHLFMERTSG